MEAHACVCLPPAAPIDLFAAFLIVRTVMRQLLDILHHAVQLSLPIDLVSTAQCKVVHFLVAPYIAKHRFHRGKAARRIRPLLVLKLDQDHFQIIQRLIGVGNRRPQ